jgi:hypothetical protein
MNIGDIIWPTPASAACKHYLRFMLLVVDELGITFENDSAPDPLPIARAYLAGEIAEPEYERASGAWLLNIEAAGGSMGSPAVLKAHIALSLLGALEETVEYIGDSLSWFLQVLAMMGYDGKQLTARMDAYFAPT